MITRLSHTEYPGSSPFTIPNNVDHVLWGERRAPRGDTEIMYIYSIIININSTTVVNPGILIKENAYLSHKTPWQCSDNIIKLRGWSPIKFHWIKIMNFTYLLTYFTFVWKIIESSSPSFCTVSLVGEKGKKSFFLFNPLTISAENYSRGICWKVSWQEILKNKRK